MDKSDIVIVGAARTPMGGFQGALKDKSATELGSAAIAAALQRAGVAGDQVDEVVMGCVLPAGLGQAPASSRGRSAWCSTLSESSARLRPRCCDWDLATAASRQLSQRRAKADRSP